MCDVCLDDHESPGAGWPWRRAVAMVALVLAGVVVMVTGPAHGGGAAAQASSRVPAQVFRRDVSAVAASGAALGAAARAACSGSVRAAGAAVAAGDRDILESLGDREQTGPSSSRAPSDWRAALVAHAKTELLMARIEGTNGPRALASLSTRLRANGTRVLARLVDPARERRNGC